MGKKAKTEGSSKLMTTEDRYYGQVPFSTYKDYVALNGGCLFVVPLLLFVSLGVLAQLWANFVIIDWCNDPDTGKYLIVYTLLTVGSGLMVGMRSLFMILSTLRQGRRLFAGMIRALLDSPVQWWDSVPTGRVMNRLTKDIT